MPRLSVIIVNYNTRDMTLRCLEALYPCLDGVDAEVLLVDNASSDGSVSAIREAFPAVRITANEKNLGFGAANNLAMARCSGEMILLLNSDAFPHAGSIEALILALESRPALGAVGPRLLNADGSLQRSCHRFPTPVRAWLENLWISALFSRHPVLGDYRRWDHDEEREVDFVIGACLLIRREVYERVGGFDEAFFMYSEETDWQLRMRHAGWKIGFTPTATVTHLGGASSAPERLNPHFFESLDYYERKHHGLAGLISLRLSMIAGCLLRTLLWSGLALARPTHRDAAIAKVKIYRQLLRRQAMHWQVLKRRCTYG